MPELPIVAETSNWGSFILGALRLIVAIALARVAWRLDGGRRIAGFAALHLGCAC